MNKLLIPNGGMFLEGDDLRFWDNGIREVFGGLLSLYADDGYLIISGMEVSTNGTTITISEGFVLFNNEVLYCPVQTFVDDNTFAVYEIALNVTNDASGLEVFADSVSRQTYEIRRAKINKLGNVVVAHSLTNTPRLRNKISEIAFDNVVEKNIQNFELLNDWVVAPGNVFKRIKQGRRVYLEGAFADGENGSVIYNLAAGYRPTHNLEFTASISIAPYFVRVTISSSNGSIAVLSDTPFNLGAGDYLSLDGISFLTS